MDTEIVLAPYGSRKGATNQPNPTQQKVLDWVDRIRSTPTEDQEHIPILYLQGGVGCGKSRGFMAPVLEMLLEIPNVRILWGRNDFKDLKLSIMDKFFEILPKELIADRNETYHWYDIRQLAGGTGRIYFNGLKDLSGLGSQEFAVIVVTEALEISEVIYRALKRRCRQENCPLMILLESEAPNEDHWLSQVTDAAHENYDPDVEKWEISTYENWANLPAAYRGSLEKMPEAWKRKYLMGKCGFIPDGKPYYSGFKEILHTGTFDWIQARPLICGWDFGFHHPAVIVTQIDLQDRWIWLRELMGFDVTIDKFADQVIRFINENFPAATCIHYGDPAVVQVTDKSEKTSYQILNAKKINLQYKTSTYRERKEIIEQKLSWLIGGKPALLVDSRCKTAVDGFLGGYHYPVRRPGQEATDKMELPYRDGFYEHVMNAAEYIAINMFTAIKIKDDGDNYIDERRRQGYGFRREKRN